MCSAAWTLTPHLPRETPLCSTCCHCCPKLQELQAVKATWFKYEWINCCRLRSGICQIKKERQTTLASKQCSRVACEILSLLVFCLWQFWQVILRDFTVSCFIPNVYVLFSIAKFILLTSNFYLLYDWSYAFPSLIAKPKVFGFSYAKLPSFKSCLLY